MTEYLYYFRSLLEIQYEAGKNILLNRFAELNNKIDKSWLNLSLETYKVKCKSLFLGGYNLNHNQEF